MPTQFKNPPTGSMMAYLGTTAPNGWVFGHGQEIEKTPETADLYDLFGDAFGTPSAPNKFVLPNLRDRFLRGACIGPMVGVRGGSSKVTLETSNLPGARCSDDDGDSDDPVGNFPAKAGEDIFSTSANSEMGGEAQAFEIIPPFLAVNFIIAL